MLLLWAALGWVALDWAGFNEPVELGLLSLVMGLAIATFVVSTASLFGASIAASCWFIVGAGVASVAARVYVVWSSQTIRSLALAMLIPFAAVALNVLVVGQGLITVGDSWQGLVNGDGATNSLGAEYFIKFPFFARLDASSVLGGFDYSPVSSSLYVESGHRFADVMLLGLSAALTSQHPDQVYMSHGMMVRVALILACAGLVYTGRRRVTEAAVAVIVLTVSSLGAYVYWNQLISQMGGIAIAVLAMILWVRVCSPELTRYARATGVTLLALVCAALFRYYPEIAPMLALSMSLSLLLRGRTYLVRQWRAWTLICLCTGLMLVIFSNASLPNAIAHILNTLGVGTSNPPQSAGIMDYAFTPDVFPLLFGFVGLKEAVADPWATVLVASSAGLLVFMAFALGARRTRFNALAAITMSVSLAFIFLWVRREEFGTFKAILFLQPFVLLIGTVVVSSLFGKRQIWILSGLAASFIALNLRVELPGAQNAVADVHPIPGLAHAKLLNVLEKYSTTATPVVFDLQSYLLQSYATLRKKQGGVTFEADPPALYFRRPSMLAAYLSLVRPDWLSVQDEFKRVVNGLPERGFQTVSFGCGPAPLRAAKFIVRTLQPDWVHRTIYAGGRLQPLNRQLDSDTDFIERGPGITTKNALLAQRESSLGGWVLAGGSVRALSDDQSLTSMFFGETDPMGQVSTMSAVGRYLLLEVVGSDSDSIRLRLRFTRSFFGPVGSKLPSVQVHGETSTGLGGHGAGAIDMTTDKIAPCKVQGRQYVMIDFGKDPEKFEKVAPFMYKALGLTYSPDTRRSVGFLRDISIVKEGETDHTSAALWGPKTGGSIEGFIGIFEDGWLSDDARIVVRPVVGVSRIRFFVEIDPVLLNPGAPVRNVVITNASGQVLGKTQLVVGSNLIDLAMPISGRLDVRLTSDSTMPLPGGDGRLVAGRLVSTLLE